jgi:hypothetical protein
VTRRLLDGDEHQGPSNPQPQPAGQLNCPTGGIWTPVQMLCEQ